MRTSSPGPVSSHKWKAPLVGAIEEDLCPLGAVDLKNGKGMLNLT